MHVESAVALGYEPDNIGSVDVGIAPFWSTEPIGDPDLLIILVDAIGSVTNMDVLGQRKLEVNRAVERGARIVLTIGANYPASHGSPFLSWLRSKFRFATAQRDALEVRAEVPRLKAFLEAQFCYATIADADGVEDVPEGGQLLGIALDSSGEFLGIAAARWSLGDAEVILLPHWQPHTPASLESFFRALDELPSREEFPAYLDRFTLGNEPQLLAELERLRERESEVETELEALREAKGVLHKTGIDLEVEVARLLTDLGLEARHVPGVREDLQLVDPATREPWAIGEVKAGERRSLERTELSKVDLHRKEAGHPDDFPALLVASTFRARESIEDRDEPMPPNIVKRATEDHILIVRALDLIRLKQLALAGKSAVTELEDALRAGGGWFEVKADSTIKVNVS